MKIKTIKLKIEGMDCGGCAVGIKNLLKVKLYALTGVASSLTGFDLESNPRVKRRGRNAAFRRT